MRVRSIFCAVVIAAVSSLATWQWAAAQGAAQRPTPYEQALESAVRSGADIGFRVEYVERNKAMGRLVVRVNGRWVDAEHSVRFTPLQH